MKNYKYTTKEEETISLHDHFIEKIIFSDNIILEMDGFDITRDNEYNKTGKHKYSEKTCIVLKNGKYKEGLFEFTTTASKEENFKETHYIEEIKEADIISNKYNFEVLEHLINYDTLDKTKKIFKIDCVDKIKFYCSLEFYCDEVIFCFNDYFSDAWFEGWNDKKSA